MANNVYAVDATWSSIEDFSVTNPNIIILDDNYNPITSGTLKSITLCANRTSNPNGTVSGGGITFAAGRITSPNAIDIYFEVYGDSYFVSETKTLNSVSSPINPIVPFKNSGYNAYAKAITPYTLSFGEGYNLTTNTKLNLRCRGVNANSINATVLSIWRQSGQKIGNRTLRLVGTADITTGPVNPTSISIESAKTRITDLSGVEPNNNGVSLGPTTTATVKAADGELTTLSFSNNDLLTLSYNIYDKTQATVYIKAKNSNTSNVTTTLTVISNGNRTASLNIYFPEKIQNVFLDSYNNIQNIKQVVDSGKKLFHLSSKYPSYSTNQIERALLDRGSFDISNNYLVPNIDVDLNKENSLFPISADNMPINLTWRFYNSMVQSSYSSSNEGSYKQDLNTVFTCTIKPNIESDFKYYWNEDSVPNILLYNQGSPIINKLEYKNNDPYGGYCRGFRVDAIPDVGNTISADYETIDKDNNSLYEGDIFNFLKDKPSGFYTIKITTYFYYNNNKNRHYDGVSVTLPQKILLISDNEILPELVFPELNKTEPYTPMLLSAVERYGYAFSDLIVNNQSSLGAIFGLSINDIDVSMLTNPDYFSSSHITQHLIFNIGKFVTEHRDLVDTLNVIPYVDISVGDYNKRIQFKENPLDKIVNTSTDITNLWLRPTVDSGELLTYFDYNRCEEYINKYKYLASLDPDEREEFKYKLGTALSQQQILTNEENFYGTMQGEIINTNFWNIVADILSEYSDNMQEWATDVINVSVWALPQFKHKKGEVIINNNLYQNYWDLLDQFNTNFTIHGEENGSDFPAVRLKNESGGEPVEYTHNELNSLNNLGYTHNEIMNQFRRKR